MKTNLILSLIALLLLVVGCADTSSPAQAEMGGGGSGGGSSSSADGGDGGQCKDCTHPPLHHTCDATDEGEACSIQCVGTCHLGACECD